MKILEHGQTQEKTLLFLPCTAEPVWAFTATVELLSQKWHVFKVVYDGHQPEYPGDFTSVEQTADEITAYLKERGVSRLGGLRMLFGRGVPDPDAGAGHHRGADHVLRAYLKTVNMPKQRVFSACCAPFSLVIHKVFLRKNGFIRRKIPRCWSYSRFSDRP